MLVSAFVADLAKRAGHTFWQTFSAALAVLWASSGLHVADLVHISAVHKLAVGVIAAAAASMLSTVKTLIAGGLPLSRSVGDVPAQQPVVLVGAATSSTAVTPADPGQPAAGVPPAAA